MEQYLSAARRVAQLAVGEPVPKMAKVTIPARRQAGGEPAVPAGLPRWRPRHARRHPASRMSSLPTANIASTSRRRLHRHGPVSARHGDRGHARASWWTAWKWCARRSADRNDLDLADRDGPRAARPSSPRCRPVPAQVTAGAHDVIDDLHRALLGVEQRRHAAAASATAAGLGMPIIRTAIEIVGPFAPQGLSLSDSRAKIFVCQPKQRGRGTALRRAASRGTWPPRRSAVP